MEKMDLSKKVLASLLTMSCVYLGGNIQSPLVKDIVGYLKMCHSILPIKR